MMTGNSDALNLSRRPGVIGWLADLVGPPQGATSPAQPSAMRWWLVGSLAFHAVALPFLHFAGRVHDTPPPLTVTLLPPPVVKPLPPPPVPHPVERPKPVVHKTVPVKPVPRVVPKPVLTRATPAPAPVVAQPETPVAPPPPVTKPMPVVAQPQPIAPKPQPVAVKPPPPKTHTVETAVDAEAVNAYGETLSDLLKKNQEYPRRALMRHWQGKVVLRIQINADGQVSNLSIASSSGHDLLDETALKMANKLQLPAPPPALQHHALTVLVPVAFILSQ